MKYSKLVALALLALLIFFAACGANPEAEEPLTEQAEVQTAAQENAREDALLAALAAMQNLTAASLTELTTQPQTSFTQAAALEIPVAVPSTAQVTNPSSSFTSAATTRSAWTYSIKTAEKTTTTERAASAVTSATTTAAVATAGNTGVFVRPTTQSPQAGKWTVSCADLKSLASSGKLAAVTYNVTTKDSIDREKARSFTGVRLRDFLELQGINVDTLRSGATLVAYASDGEKTEYSLIAVRHNNTVLAWQDGSEALAKPRMCPGDSTLSGDFLKDVTTIELKSQ